MNMLYASIYLYLPQFLSSVFCSFPSTGLLPPWLNLFLGTLFFLLLCKWLLFCQVLFLIFHCSCTPSLHPQDESYLIMVCDLFNVLPDAVCQHFVEDFSIYVHQRCWPVVFFLCCVFTWFWNQDYYGLIKCVWESSFS